MAWYEDNRDRRWRGGGAAGGGFAYFLGMIGTAVFYVQQSTTFGGDIIGLLKALVWPAFLAHHLFLLH